MKRLNLLLLVIVLGSCSRQMDYPIGHIPEELKNFKEVNSSYDDYNSNLNQIGGRYILQFSTNRYSGGQQYDFVKMAGTFSWNQDNGHYSERIEHIGQWSMYDSITTSANELGPYARDFDTSEGHKYVMLYANDETGNFDIKFSHQLSTEYGVNLQSACASPQSVAFLSSPANELYPSFLIRGETGNYNEPGPIEKMFYCSDESGNFNIYQIDFPSNENVISFLSSKSAGQPDAISILNTAYEDKCPFFANNRLIFASNRPGGFGGFDLYYSVYENGSFSEPVNFGDKVNTEYDEYRPIIEAPAKFDNELILFSSNRPGGKGGYDLYYTGIAKVK